AIISTSPTRRMTGLWSTTAHSAMGRPIILLPTWFSRETIWRNRRGSRRIRTGNFYVSSEPHNQVYEYTQPVALDTADLLNLMIGPGAQNPNAGTLQFPMGLAIDAVNNLYVADQANNRVLEFNEGSSPGNKVANGVGGQINLSHNAPNYVDAVGVDQPGGIAVDASS